MEKLKSEAYSRHRYIDENGAPDYERIFIEGDSKFWVMRHLDPWLSGHFKNQPEIVQNDQKIKRHLESCEECKQKLQSKKTQ